VHPRTRYDYYDLKPASGSFLADVLAGLSLERKALPPKYFYDEQGSLFFEAICEQPEYYPTRTELAMLREFGRDIAEHTGSDSSVVEFGTGSGRKTHLLLEALRPRSYCAIDIAGDQLRAAAETLARAFPSVRVCAVCADYGAPLEIPVLDELAGTRRVIFFPGSTIGNLLREEALRFLERARGIAGRSGAMVIGVDLVKDPRLLDAAYNDVAGVTAAFNLNLLHRINRELGGDFDLTAYRHLAFYNPREQRVEMHLVSTCNQSVSVAGRSFHFDAGESVHTENSYKYTVDGFRSLARQAGFAPRECWVDRQGLFSIHLLEVSA
jgi:dimethylhistidine N-methyltransferase